MDVSSIFDGLNDPQRDAVAAEPGPLLVLAGAGSGKTRVLTHRVAWLVQALQVSPLAILAVTFTNKASREMRNRIEQMLGFPVGGMWMGTFHGLCHRLLRAHWQEAGLPQGFQILDSDDQLRVIRRALRELDLDEGYWPPRQVQWFINDHKEAGRRPQRLPDGRDAQEVQRLRLYRHYEELCRRLGLVDFPELMLRSVELLENNETLGEHYRQRFQHVLVDEFQDTNAIQYRWLELLVGPTRSLFVVGDDDQSIYGWRGARVENILRFEKDFPGTQVVRLEQNYRSTTNILEAANGIIGYNQGRLGKKLWTDAGEGPPVRLYTAYNELDEARFVVERIQDFVAAGNQRSQAAILYRSNAQSRTFEEVLLDVGMPYRVYGGLRFFERQEIKDALAYLRLAASRDDDPSFERVVNLPTRGIGNRTLDAIRTRARDSGHSMWDSARALIEEKELAARACDALARFLIIIERMADSMRDESLGRQVEIMLAASGLIEHYRREKGERAEARVENLEELVTAARNFTFDADEQGEPLSAFLANAALESGEGQAEEWEDCVQLMSLHSAKGLEFGLVFLTGLEEGLFPHQRSLQEAGRLEEERRLCYVGMTRAMRELYLSYAENRRLYGRDHHTSPSRFLLEIPPERLEAVRGGSQTSSRQTASAPSRGQAQAPTVTAEPLPAGITLGARVRHAKFGEGTVVNIEGRGDHARVQVNFEGAGGKWLVLAYARLQPV